MVSISIFIMNFKFVSIFYFIMNISEFYFLIKNNDYFLSFKIKLIMITVPDYFS